MANRSIQGTVALTAAVYEKEDYESYRIRGLDKRNSAKGEPVFEAGLNADGDFEAVFSDAYTREQSAEGAPEIVFEVESKSDASRPVFNTKEAVAPKGSGTTSGSVSLWNKNAEVGHVKYSLTTEADSGYAAPTAQAQHAGGPQPRSSRRSVGAPTPGYATIGVMESIPQDNLTEIRVAPAIERAFTSPQVAMRRPELIASEDQPLWVTIRDRTSAIGFDNYQKFMDDVFCETGERPHASSDSAACESRLDQLRRLRPARTHMGSVDAYKLLEVATDAFLLLHCGIHIGDDYSEVKEASRLGDTVPVDVIRDRLSEYLGQSGTLPYLDQIISNLSIRENDPVLCGSGYMGTRVNCPCLIELIWSYWHEEGMLVQATNAVAMRFQNRRVTNRNVLANLEIDPLRPLNNLLWGYVQDETRRLSVPRRAYEYDHHYGLHLVGRAVPNLKTADSRSKFIEAFHNLLQRASVFYQEDAHLDMISDGFPLLNALKEVHLILAFGAHNQFGDLPWTARKEMLIMQYLLSRPEMRAFLGGRAMVPYTEGWMGQVDTMKQLMRWTDTSVTHFRDLGVYGEQILLSIRYGNWSDVNDQNQAKNWARYWRPEVQAYVYAYQAATGVDLTADVVSTNASQARSLQPSVHLRQQLARQAPNGSSRSQAGRAVAAEKRTNGRS
jgi:hypothetical protein